MPNDFESTWQSQGHDLYPGFKECAREWWEAGRRAAIEEAHSACLAGVKWSPEPSKQIQFYVNGTCHRLAAEISKLANGDSNG